MKSTSCTARPAALPTFLDSETGMPSWTSTGQCQRTGINWWHTGLPLVGRQGHLPYLNQAVVKIRCGWAKMYFGKLQLDQSQ